jgi:hypothetical protein
MGIVTGGIDPSELSEFCGSEIGVAITGEENVGLTLIITEGFGNMNMAKKTFNLFKHFEGHLVCLNGATQIRAGVMRPEIIIPHDEPSEDSLMDKLLDGLVYGTLVRIIREPNFGVIGKVVELPIELEKIQTESSVRILKVELEDGRIVSVPRANVEIIEE